MVRRRESIWASSHSQNQASKDFQTKRGLILGNKRVGDWHANEQSIWKAAQQQVVPRCTNKMIMCLPKFYAQQKHCKRKGTASFCQQTGRNELGNLDLSRPRLQSRSFNIDTILKLLTSDIPLGEICMRPLARRRALVNNEDFSRGMKMLHTLGYICLHLTLRSVVLCWPNGLIFLCLNLRLIRIFVGLSQLLQGSRGSNRSKGRLAMANMGNSARETCHPSCLQLFESLVWT